MPVYWLARGCKIEGSFPLPIKQFSQLLQILLAQPLAKPFSLHQTMRLQHALERIYLYGNYRLRVTYHEHYRKNFS